MHRLTQHLRFFVRKKMAEDAAWRRVEVLFATFFYVYLYC